MTKQKQKYIFAIDLHNVLFKYSFASALRLIVTELPFLSALKMLAHPSFFWRLYKVSRKTRVLDDIFERVEKEYPQAQALWPFVHKLTNCQVPNDTLLAVLAQLRQEGHALVLFSNIAPLSLLELKKNYEQLFALFDGEVTPRKQDGYAQKPEEAFFKRLIQIRSEPAFADQEIIVVDDRKTNCLQAEKMGLRALCFKKTSQFIAFLKALVLP